MRDPIDELEHFTDPGLTMNPLPASEVRRRGTRMRRRNNALAAIGGVAAVAIIATPLAMAASNDRTDTTPPPATESPSPTVTWLQEIPEDFPIDRGLAGSDQGDSLNASADLSVCGSDATALVTTGPDVVAGAGAESGVPDSEGGEARTLTLYADDRAAIAATTALEELVTGCGTDPNGTGDPLLNEVKAGDLGGDASLVVTQQAQGSDGLLSQLTTMEVVRTGNAVYVVSSFTSAGGQQVIDGEVQRLAESSAPIIEAMTVFGGAG
jgi:hypothetical protein